MFPVHLVIFSFCFFLTSRSLCFWVSILRRIWVTFPHVSSKLFHVILGQYLPVDFGNIFLAFFFLEEGGGASVYATFG